MYKVAPQADLCYNVSNKLFAAAMLEASRDVSRYWIGVPTMDTLPPYASNGNPSSHIPHASGIYKITCLASSKIYIGSASNLRYRRKTHFSKLRLNKHANSHMQNAYNKYGQESFVFEVLEYVLPISLPLREQYWIDKLKPTYNIALVAGSRFGIKESAEIREKKRQAKIGHKSTFGYKHSPESIEKMRQAHIGHPVTVETREKISQGNKGNKSRTGMKTSSETIEKIRQSKIGRKNPRKDKDIWR